MPGPFLPPGAAHAGRFAGPRRRFVPDSDGAAWYGALKLNFNDGEIMLRSLSILSLATTLGLAGATFAQDADGEATASETADSEAPSEGTAATGTTGAFAPGKEVEDGEPAVYIKEKFGDWSLRCFRNENGDDPCQLYQLLREEGGNPVAEFSVFRIDNQTPAVAGATAIVPLVTLLTEELKLSVDGGTAKSYPYRVCTEAGCVAQMGLTAEDVNRFKKGAKAQMVLVPAQAPDQTVTIDISLTGFTDGYEAVGEFTR